MTETERETVFRDGYRAGIKVLDRLDAIQNEIIEWQVRNFGHGPYTWPLMGMAEELGELNHAFLKDEQNIRGTEAEHMAAARDAIGDLLVYTMALCQLRGWRLSDIIEETWAQVSQRDWVKYPKNGLTE